MIKNIYFDGKIEDKLYKIVELQERIGFVILDEQDEEIILDNIFISEISEIIFKIEILTDNFFFVKERTKEKLKKLYYTGIVEIIILCIKNNNKLKIEENSKDNKVLIEIKDLIKKVDEELDDRLFNRNQMYYFSAYLVILLFSCLFYICINYIVYMNSETLDFIKSMNMGILGGFIAVNYRLAYRASFNTTYSYIYCFILGLGRACYSMIAGIVAYYLYYSGVIELPKNSNILYLLAISLGYGIRYMPSILGSVASKVGAEGNNSKKN
ncbi:hypothetical protein [Candidatus Cetobacterium colombiensis]|uniref:Uncharacterized protein n=1 Tax=Candidatus Cetobacterium colombiensis TaxID=3073100 RepID=A0ABU4WC34_9FUSO|nr:hypothetical protein [Candidatus Cetobacterium colombiensis]MDX8336592.1 hypothetical protein [Candidatus Cetobacterium colombiensis]